MRALTRRGFVACLSGLAVALLAPVRLLAGSAPAPEALRFPAVRTYRAWVSATRFNLIDLGQQDGRADIRNRASLESMAELSFGPGRLQFVGNKVDGGAVVPCYHWV